MSFELPLHVETAGLDPGQDIPTFLLIHGYGASSFTWRSWIPELSRRGHVVMVDMKGFGDAPRPDDGRYSPADQAELIHRLIVQRDLNRVFIAGHSLGGGVALIVALRLLDEARTRGTLSRLSGLISMAGASYLQRLPPFVALSRHPWLSALVFRLLGPRRLIRLVFRTIVHDNSRVTRTQVEGYADPLRRPDALQGLLWAAAQIVPPDLEAQTARYGEIDVPALLIWGRQDPVIRLWVGERLEQDLPQATLVVLDECGHMPQEERTEDVLEILGEFLDGVAAT